MELGFKKLKHGNSLAKTWKKKVCPEIAKHAARWLLHEPWLKRPAANQFSTHDASPDAERLILLTDNSPKEFGNDWYENQILKRKHHQWTSSPLPFSLIPKIAKSDGIIFIMNLYIVNGPRREMRVIWGEIELSFSVCGYFHTVSEVLKFEFQKNHRFSHFSPWTVYRHYFSRF